MKSLKVKTNIPYGVLIGENVHEYLGNLLSETKKILIVSDDNVYIQFGRKIKKALESTKAEVSVFLMADGENAKSKFILDKLITEISNLNLTKSDCVIALGGGTVSDVTGFACSIYKRGISYVNLPTTLLSMADASIGGKTAVDFLGIKNLLGTIYQPKAVLIDTSFIKSLSPLEVSNGMVEIIKSAVIGDEKLFKKLENGNLSYEEMIYRTLKLKAKIVAKDEFDLSKRKLLNFGHTVGHAIESVSNFYISHGSAVAFGMIEETKFAERIKLANNISDRIINVLKKYNVKTDLKVDLAGAYKFMLNDKKFDGEKITFSIPKKIGKCVLYKAKVEQVMGGLVNGYKNISE